MSRPYRSAGKSSGKKPSARQAAPKQVQSGKGEQTKAEPVSARCEEGSRAEAGKGKKGFFRRLFGGRK